MPIVEKSSYKAPFLLGNKHFQTIVPSYFSKLEEVEYTREEFTAPDGDPILLDWSRTGSDKLLIINHGLCGHPRRHYVLSFIKSFNAIGWDCLVWDYRWTGVTITNSLDFTTSDSTEQLGWVTEHAIAEYGYGKVAMAGFSMGGNLCLLYLGREAEKVPRQVIGAVAVCATIDPERCATELDSFMTRVYMEHFTKVLNRMIIRKHAAHPDEIDIEGIEKIKTLKDFDSRYTAPLCGYDSAEDYWRKSAAYQWLDRIRRPSLIINPLNDPFLTGECYPRETAGKSEYVYLETPRSGGHCGFITGGGREWWPATRAREFLAPLAE